MQPTRGLRGVTSIAPLFGFALGGVYPATSVTTCAVRSYRTISPLLLLQRYIFCGTSRQFTLPRRYLAPYSIETGLSSVTSYSDCLTDSADSITVQVEIDEDHPPLPEIKCLSLRVGL